MWEVIFGYNLTFKKVRTYKIKEGANNLVYFLKEWLTCSMLDSGMALLFVMFYQYICIPQSQVRIWFCQHSTDTIRRCQLLTWRSVLFLDFETKAVGYGKIGLSKATIIGEQNKHFFSRHGYSLLGSWKIHNENLEDTKWHSECLWRSYLFRLPPKRVAPGPWL